VVLPDNSQEKVMAKLLPETWKTEKPLSNNNKEGKRYFRLTEYFFINDIGLMKTIGNKPRAVFLTVILYCVNNY